MTSMSAPLHVWGCMVVTFDTVQYWADGAASARVVLHQHGGRVADMARRGWTRIHPDITMLRPLLLRATA